MTQRTLSLLRHGDAYRPSRALRISTTLKYARQREIDRLAQRCVQQQLSADWFTPAPQYVLKALHSPSVDLSKWIWPSYILPIWHSSTIASNKHPPTSNMLLVGHNQIELHDPQS